MSQQTCPLCGESVFIGSGFLTAEMVTKFPKEMLFAFAAGVPLDSELQPDGKTLRIRTRYPVAIRYDHYGVVAEILVKVPMK